MTADVYWVAGLFAAGLVTAALVNALAPERRKLLRRVAILYGLYVVVLAARHATGALGAETWSERLMVGAELLRAFAVVHIASTLVAVTLPRIGINPPMIVTDIVVGIGYFLVTIGVLSDHGADPSSVLATSAVVSAILAISLQSTLGNILGGVALQLDGSIHEGDWVQLESGQQGRVQAIRWRHTVVETRNWSTIIVPNARLLSSNIQILGRRGGRDVPQRMWVWFNVDYRYSPDQVISVVSEAMSASPIEGVATDPGPSVVCMDFMRQGNQSMASYAVRYWLTDLARDDPTSSKVRARLYAALTRAGIPLAVPAQTAFVELQDQARQVDREARRLEARIAAMRAVPIFRSLTDAEIETLARGVDRKLYAAGEVITRQGGRAHWLYVMTRGRAEVRHTYDPDGDGPIPAASERVAELVAPDFFGEMGLMTGEPRQADVVATSDVECLRLGKETFEKVLLARPEIVLELSERLAARQVELYSVREGMDAEARRSRQEDEREAILASIKGFFGM